MPTRAIERRNWVLGQMESNGFITAAQRAAAQAAPLGIVGRQAPERQDAGGYFMEEVRRELIEQLRRGGQGRPVQRLFGRAVGAHLVRSGAAEGGRDGAARRPRPLRSRQGLERADPP